MLKHVNFLWVIVMLFSCTNSPKSTNKLSENSVKAEDSLSAIRTNEPKYCANLAEEILKSSPRYKKLTDGLLAAVRKNGGTSVSVVMEKSPESAKGTYEYSTNFEMQVNENYPDRKVNIGRFVFDPGKGQLYEYDVIGDSLVSIEFDNELLVNSGKYCK